MVEFHTPEEILRFALNREKESERIYRQLSDAVDDVAAQSIFLALAHAEEKQKKAIELELLKIGSIVSETNVSEQPRKEEWPDWRLLAKRMLLQDVFDLAIHRQRESFHLFTELMGKAENSEAADVLFHLAQEEMRHLLQLEKEYKSIFPNCKL